MPTSPGRSPRPGRHLTGHLPVKPLPRTVTHPARACNLSQRDGGHYAAAGGGPAACLRQTRNAIAAVTPCDGRNVCSIRCSSCLLPLLPLRHSNLSGGGGSISVIGHGLAALGSGDAGPQHRRRLRSPRRQRQDTPLPLLLSLAPTAAPSPGADSSAATPSIASHSSGWCDSRAATASATTPLRRSHAPAVRRLQSTPGIGIRWIEHFDELVAPSPSIPCASSTDLTTAVAGTSPAAAAAGPPPRPRRPAPGGSTHQRLPPLDL